MNYLDEGGVTKISRLVKQGFVAKENGKGLSTNDFTNAYKEKLDNLTSVFRFKGIVATITDLPSTADDGDIYGVGTAQIGFEGYIYFSGTWHAWESITPNEVSYDLLQDKPSIEGVVLEGAKTATDLSLVSEPTFTTAMNNKLDAPLNSGTAGTVLINNADGTYEWGTIGGSLSAGNQTINGVVTINVTSTAGIACWILNRNNTTAGFIELKYANARTFVIGKGSTDNNYIYMNSYGGYEIRIESNAKLRLGGTTIEFSRCPTCTVAPASNNDFIRKIDIKTIVAQSTDFADFKQRMATW